MSSFSLAHWLIVLVLVASWLIPGAIILKRLGLSRWWVLLGVVPVVGLLSLWLLAFAKWPYDDEYQPETIHQPPEPSRQTIRMGSEG